jgi:hypothetical protein
MAFLLNYVNNMMNPTIETKKSNIMNNAIKTLHANTMTNNYPNLEEQIKKFIITIFNDFNKLDSNLTVYDCNGAVRKIYYCIVSINMTIDEFDRNIKHLPKKLWECFSYNWTDKALMVESCKFERFIALACDKNINLYFPDLRYRLNALLDDPNLAFNNCNIDIDINPTDVLQCIHNIMRRCEVRYNDYDWFTKKHMWWVTDNKLVIASPNFINCIPEYLAHVTDDGIIININCIKEINKWFHSDFVFHTEKHLLRNEHDLMIKLHNYFGLNEPVCATKYLWIGWNKIPAHILTQTLLQNPLIGHYVRADVPNRIVFEDIIKVYNILWNEWFKRYCHEIQNNLNAPMVLTSVITQYVARS